MFNATMPKKTKKRRMMKAPKSLMLSRPICIDISDYTVIDPRTVMVIDSDAFTAKLTVFCARLNVKRAI